MQMCLHKLELHKSSRIPHMAEQAKRNTTERMIAFLILEGKQSLFLPVIQCTQNILLCVVQTICNRRNGEGNRRRVQMSEQE